MLQRLENLLLEIIAYARIKMIMKQTRLSILTCHSGILTCFNISDTTKLSSCKIALFKLLSLSKSLFALIQLVKKFLIGQSS